MSTTTATAPALAQPPVSVLRFVRHYAEMVAAMFAGMLVLGVPAEGALLALGTSGAELRDDAPAVYLLGMAAVMTVPMVAWMRVRRHRWQPCLEMAASMVVPTLVVIGAMWTGLIGDVMTAMGIQHVAMFPAMLAVMLLRPREYACAGHGRHGTAAAEERAR